MAEIPFAQHLLLLHTSVYQTIFVDPLECLPFPRAPALSPQHCTLHEVIQNSEKPYVVVNLYATYSKPSLKEIPELIKVKNDLNGETEVIFISIDDEKDVKTKLAGFLHDQKMNFPTYYYHFDSVRKFVRDVYPQWNHQVPLNLVFSNNGELIEQTGMTDQDEIEMIINQYKNFN